MKNRPAERAPPGPNWKAALRACGKATPLSCGGWIVWAEIDFESLTEKIDTGSPAGRLVFHVFAALAEFERNLIRERTVAGLKAARARGRKGGRPAKLSAKEVKIIRSLLKTADMPVAEIAARFGVARSTLYRTVLRPAL